jgi:hypothetical protein
MVHISNINTLKSVYYAYFPSIIEYEIIFGGNSFNNRKIFRITKEDNQNCGCCTLELHVEVCLNY